MMQLAGLMRNKGCTGACLPRFAARARKLFHKATILVGAQGASSVQSSSARLFPVGRGSANMSPAYSAMRSPSRMANPAGMSCDLKRAQVTEPRPYYPCRRSAPMLQDRLEQFTHLGRIACDLDAARFHHG